MTIIIRRIMPVLSMVGIGLCLCMGRSHCQTSDKPKVALSEPQNSSTTKLDLPELVYSYYEWVAKDKALAWVEKSDGSVVAIPLTGERREEQPIGGASDLKEMRHGHPYALRRSPDGSKIVYLMGGWGGQASEWRAGTLNGTNYTHGPLLVPQGWNLVWSRNSKLQPVYFRQKSDEWETPPELFAELDREFHFTLDVAALPDNAKCDEFYTPGEDGLLQDWKGVCWMNPPYGLALRQWVKKAQESAMAGATVVCLLPARTDTTWWHDHVQGHAEIRFLRGRAKFGGVDNSAPFPSAIIVFRPAEARE